MKEIKIVDLIKTNLAVSSEKGKYISEVVSKNFKQGIPVKLNFSGIDIMTTSFLNSAVGDLYLLGDSKQLNRLITIDGNSLKPSQREKVKMVMKNSKHKISQEAFDGVAIYGE